MQGDREKNLVSIVVSNYNNEKYIKECLESLRKQTYKNIEIIIIDDASTDNSAKIIKDWIENEGNELNINNKIYFQKLRRNIGFSGAVTLGLYNTKGEYIAMQDGDDLSVKERIERQINFLKNSNVEVVGSKFKGFDDFGNEFESKGFLEFGVDNIRRRFEKGGQGVSCGTIVFKGYLFDIIGGLTRRINGAEDYEFITKLLPYGIDNIPEVLYKYRNHGKQRSKIFYSKKKIKNLNDIKILMVVDKFNIGGTETHVLALSKFLLTQGINLVIVAGNGPLINEFKELNCSIYNLNFPASIIKNNDEKRVFEEIIENIIKTENINIIHTHQSSSGSICESVARKQKIPLIFSIHGMYYFDIVSNLLKRCQKVISVSSPVYKWLSNFNIQSKVIPNGVDYEKFSQQYNTNGIREKYNIKKDEKVILYCSRIAWEKTKVGENIIRVCKDLNIKENCNVHLLIVGDGEGAVSLVDKMKRANKKLNKEYIHFVGASTCVEKYYSIADIVVGTGRVAIEGMASKKVVIATGNHGYYGIIRNENFYDAWEKYFGDHDSIKPNNPLYLYEDLNHVLSNIDNYENEVNSIYEKSKKIFDIKEMSKAILNEYIEILK